MLFDLAVKVSNVSKRYEIYKSPRDRLKQYILPKIRKLLHLKPKRYYDEFWALKEITLEIKKGQTVGIVGKNGSGKSTLLQIICGTLNQTCGDVVTNGRIAALLELGSGFDPDFTGRENVYLNGSILGLTNIEIDKRFKDIVDFADIWDFIDQPVKTYSSGMMVRLAFAVAINVEPEILIVDEALSVGDELFQRKCFSKIEEIKRKGATILFVSHSGSTVVSLCDKAFFIDSGTQITYGDPKQVVSYYQKFLYASESQKKIIIEEIKEIAGDMPAAMDSSSKILNQPVSNIVDESMGNKGDNDSYDEMLTPHHTVSYTSQGALISDVYVYTLDGIKVNNLMSTKKYKFCYSVLFQNDSSNVKFGMLIKTTAGVELGGAASQDNEGNGLPFVKAGSVYKVEFIITAFLNPGLYFLNAGVVGDINNNNTYLHRLIDAAVIRVREKTPSISTGFVNFECESRSWCEQA